VCVDGSQLMAHNGSRACVAALIMRMMAMSQPSISNPVARAGSHSTGTAPRNGWAGLVPELGVSNIQESLAFWCGLLGFEIAYDRPAARFAYLVRDRLQVMLCERNGRWEPAEMRRPFGLGINFQMMVERVAPILT